MFIRSCLAALCIALAALPAAAQQARKFGVLSLIGDSFLIVNHEGAKGSVPASDVRTVVHLPEHAFDNAVAADVRDVIRNRTPGADVAILTATQALYPREGDSLEDPRPVLARVQAAAASAGITHLVLVTKLRRHADVPLEAKDAEQLLEGLGFYLDPAAPTGNRDAPAAGYLAPFAYFRVWLVDVDRQKVIGYREVTELSPVARARLSTQQLWESMPSGEKVRLTHALVREGVQGALGELLGNLPD